MQELSWASVLGPLLAGKSLTVGQSVWAMEQIMSGRATGAQVGAFLAALRAKGESVHEMLGLVQTMRDFSQKVDAGDGLVDTCGTGGDRSGSINVSTIAAFVAAGAGARVAKHGNRAASSVCGSADLLEELGVRIDLGPEGVARCILEAGIGFCMAPVFHPAMKYVVPVRKELGVATVFNFLGPLTNPAGAKHQAIGVSDREMAPKMVDVLSRLGAVHVLVFHGLDGLDEISTAAPSLLWELKDGKVETSVVDPADFGLQTVESSALKGGTPSQNAAVARQVLEGKPGPARDVVLVNAGAAIIAADLEEAFPEALDRARDSLDSGAAAKSLERLVAVSNAG